MTITAPAATTTVSTYNVRAVRWEGGWELHIDGVGVTQSHTLRDAERMVRSYLNLVAGVTDAEVTITPEINAEIDAEVSNARTATAAAAEAQLSAAASLRAAARHLRAMGFKGGEVGLILGVSPQRVSQLLR